MANVESSARSNFFKVKDDEQFLNWVGEFGNIEAHYEDGKFVLLEAHGEGWPFTRDYEEPIEHETEDGRKITLYDEEIDFADELSEHLAEGEVAVLEEAGHEKLRYVFGHAVAVNHKGEQLHVDLTDIYEKVKEAGWSDHVTEAAY